MSPDAAHVRRPQHTPLEILQLANTAKTKIVGMLSQVLNQNWSMQVLIYGNSHRIFLDEICGSYRIFPRIHCEAHSNFNKCLSTFSAEWILHVYKKVRKAWQRRMEIIRREQQYESLSAEAKAQIQSLNGVQQLSAPSGTIFTLRPYSGPDMTPDNRGCT